MFSTSLLRHVIPMALLTAAMTLPSNAQTAEFRVNTAIYQGSSASPSSEHLILFRDGLVYDLPVNDEHPITCYDSERKRVVLLDQHEQLRTTLSTDDLVRITAQARAAAGTREQQQRLGMLATTEIDESGKFYSIRFENTEYRTQVQKPTNIDIALQYGQFADLASRLNLVRRLGLPPFARMMLDQRIAADGHLPKETTLTLRRGLTTTRFRSTHEVIAQLSNQDRKKIEEIGSMLALYREVPLDEM